MRLDLPRSFPIWSPLNLQPTMLLRIEKIKTVINLFQCCVTRRISFFRQTKIDTSLQFLSILELKGKEFPQDWTFMKIDSSRLILTLKLRQNQKMCSVWNIKKSRCVTLQNISSRTTLCRHRNTLSKMKQSKRGQILDLSILQNAFREIGRWIREALNSQNQSVLTILRLLSKG